jgi:hypothetical protein
MKRTDEGGFSGEYKESNIADEVEKYIDAWLTEEKYTAYRGHLGYPIGEYRRVFTFIIEAAHLLSEGPHVSDPKVVKLLELAIKETHLVSVDIHGAKL